MPFVASYFRRSPGAAQETPIPPRRLDVVVYGPDGSRPLRDRSNARYALESLNFDSALPGGFLHAGFTLRKPAAAAWPGREGLTVVIRRGSKTLWWGWIEDISRTQRGRIEEITVACYGPWQEATQRHCSPAYGSTMYGDAAIAQELRMNCPDISTNVAGLTPTNVDLAPLAWTNRPVSDLVKVVCDAGNDLGQTMLFAIWEPSGLSTGGYAGAINPNPDFEQAGSGGIPYGWMHYVWIGDPQLEWTTARYNSASHGVRVYRGSAAGTQMGWVGTHQALYFAVTAGTTYTVDYWVYMGAVSSAQCWGRMNWYNAAGGTIRQDALTVRYSTGSAFGARYVEDATAPANAALCRLDLAYHLPDSGTESYMVFDDAYVYAPGATLALDRRPRAWLWPRDLSGADYLLYTAGLADGLEVASTTRDLVNYVVASYGSGPSTTAPALDVDSQAAYRRRDALISAGQEASATVAAAMRDAHLAAHKTPAREPGSIKLVRPGALRLQHGGRVWPEDLRAGDRVRIADGPAAGTVLLLTRVAYSDGEVAATPERADDASSMLAKI